MLPFLCQYAKRHCRCKMWRCQKSKTKLVFISDQFSISCQIWMDSTKNWRTQIIIIIIIIILHFATATAKDQNIFISLGNKVSPRTMIKVTLSQTKRCRGTLHCQQVCNRRAEYCARNDKRPAEVL